jgi:hypothetical protein
MTYSQAVVEVLEKCAAGIPMHYRDVARHAISMGLLSAAVKAVDIGVNVALNKSPLVVPAGGGFYGLLHWSTAPSALSILSELDEISDAEKEGDGSSQLWVPSSGSRMIAPLSGSVSLSAGRGGAGVNDEARSAAFISSLHRPNGPATQRVDSSFSWMRRLIGFHD